MRLASILAQVLAAATVTTLAAGCGGSVASDVLEPTSGEGTPSGGGSTGGRPPTTTPTSPRPVPRDAGAPDAGDKCAPVLLRPDTGCGTLWHTPCGIPKGVDPSDGMSDEECAKVCGPKKNGNYWGCGLYQLDDQPGPAFECYSCVEGRRPDGYVESASDPTVAGWLAHAADLERVSIDAFQILHRELSQYGAPSELLRDVRRAEQDEVRHTRAMSELARREGATLSNQPIKHGSVRALVDIAVENAVEGCIRETYGAIVASWQAKHAARLDVRRAMTSICQDETMHADLAWRVHAWIMDRLTPSERAHVVAMMDAAVESLARSARVAVTEDLRDALGLPSAIEASKLLDGLEAHLWVSARAA